MSGERPRRRWYLHRTILFLAALALAWTAWSVYASATASGKLDPALRAALRDSPTVDIWIELPFRPEEFHVRYLQERGTVSGVEGRWVHLLRVRPAVVRSIARLYWVERVQAGAPGGAAPGGS